jgi:hypothetical protein
MSHWRRQPRDPFGIAMRRPALSAFVVLGLAGVWWAVRPGVLYRLARANLGNAACGALIDRAIVERNPDLDWRRDPAYSAFGRFTWHAQSFATARVRGAITPLEVYTSGSERSAYLVVDDRLNRLAEMRANDQWYLPIDDRDANGSIEVVASWWESGGSMRFAVISVGARAHTLIAVVEQRPTRGGAATGMQWPPMWTNADGDTLHELEWVNYGAWTGAGATTATSEFKLRWLAPGRMTYDGDLPAGYKVWLADEKRSITFGPDESAADVARRALGE